MSFFIGLFSDVHFFNVVIRALLSGLGLAVLCVGISFIYQKFLSNDNASFSSDADLSSQKTVTGGVVNIVVDDSNLEDDGNSPKFNVMNNHHSDLAKPAAPEQPASEQPESPAFNAVSASESVPDNAEDSSFKPVSLASAAPAVSSAEAAPVTPASTPAPSASAEAKPVSPEEAVSGSPDSLDELPDLGGMGSEIGTVSSPSNYGSNSSAEVIQDTEFATGGSKLKEQPISGDTNVMAKAIQTLLAREN
ncbi:hypothetical protein [uncultured Treponema sp.]|uniref:hypothetical protein n=1 Tax=uncultured Treponema sp. TaxID=162155 RepID=UPI0025EE7609|nr:hypothetical protein [uncultured Treponema sp.]